MDRNELARAHWVKSSRSNGQGNCVEVADLDAGTGVRDSKDQGGPALVFDAAGWMNFISATKDGKFNLPS
ncbi:DUF397 domain-containing protein [Micromonospora sp. C51]|uniref:DUF397 domain-containing protein n=1 Tax=Micromonospora sp. C51 TaxID=2824879 RepID=UPI001B36E444|nr:DUF397 domain-containing protein [Micromonospora sp. C51]MBQ1047806.1 DUF397 domain-containing protein [Micromonospora sp. C51]